MSEMTWRVGGIVATKIRAGSSCRPEGSLLAGEGTSYNLQLTRSAVLVKVDRVL
jgi:hypothetical protein